jgi:hypothetical protein
MSAGGAGSGPVPSSASRFGRRLGIITLGALIVRVLVVVLVDPHVPALGDASAYHLLSNHLADGRGYIRPFDLVRFHLVVPTAEYPPFHPFVLSLFARAGLRSVEAQRIALCAVGAATVGLVGLVGRQIVSDSVGLVAAVLAAISPMMFLPEATLMSETLFVFLVTLALFQAGRVRAAPTPARFAVLGLILGLGVLTRAEAGVLALLLIVPLAIRVPAASPLRRVALAGLGLVVVGAVVVPWTLRNQSTFDAFVPVSNNLGTALAGANCALTYSGPSLGSWRSTFGTGDAATGSCFTGFNGTQPQFNEATAAAAARHQGLSYAGDHRGDLPKVLAARVLRTLGVFRPAQQIQLETLEGRPHGLEQAGTWLEWCLYPFAAYGLYRLIRRRAPVGALLATIASVAIATLVTYGNQRFRIGAEPAILIATATTLVALAARTTGTATDSAESVPAGAHR